MLTQPETSTRLKPEFMVVVDKIYGEMCNLQPGTKVLIKLGFGTDGFGGGHAYQLQEFRLRGEVQRPFEVLHSATGINAEILQRPNDIGCIKEGAYADLLLINGNPLEDLSLFYRDKSAIELVLKGGEIVNGHPQ
jgi:imidazolonepropionase-like amidohydrolase